MNQRDATRILGHSYTLEVAERCHYDWCDNRAYHHHVERMTPREQFVDAIGCAAQTAAVLFVIVALFAGLFLMGMGVEGPRP